MLPPYSTVFHHINRYVRRLTTILERTCVLPLTTVRRFRQIFLEFFVKCQYGGMEHTVVKE